jgi:hypothetical protein
MRYTYLGNRHTDPALVGLQCDPVKNAAGKCVIGKMSSALVVDEHGARYIVSRRRLRVNR